MAFLTDSSLNNLTVTAFGNVSPSTSVKKFGSGAAYFDGNGDYLTVPDDDVFELGANDFTTECWFNLQTLKGYQAILAKSFQEADQHGYLLYFETGNQLNFIAGNGSWQGLLLSNVVPETNVWNHVAVTRSGNNWKLLLNGQIIASQTISIALTSGDLPLYIGRYPYFPGASLSQTFDGYLDDLRITKGVARYTANFTPPTAPSPNPTDPYGSSVSLLLHSDGPEDSIVFIDSSLNNFSVTATGNARIKTGTKKFGAGAAYFGGDSDRLTIPDSPLFYFGNGDYTVEAWLYPVALGGSDTGNFFSQSQDLSNNANRQFSFSIYTNGLRVYWTTDGVFDQFQVFQANSPIPTNQWVHVAFTRSGGVLRAFLNGQQIDSSYPNNFTYFNSTAPVSVGSFGNYASNGYGYLNFNGYIDDLRVTKGVARYTSNFTPPTSAFPNP